MSAPVLVKVPIRSRPEGWLKVDGYRPVKGLAVHRDLNPYDKGGWTITHTRSGRAVTKRLPSRKAAMAEAIRLAGLFDWSKSGSAVVAHFKGRKP